MMSSYPSATLRPAVAELPDSGIVAIANYGRQRPGLIPLWFGEGDLPTPEFICEAAAQSLRAGETFYTYQRGLPELRQAIADYHRRFGDGDLGAERIIVTSSGMQAIVNAVQATVGAGDEMAVVCPVWPNILATVALQQATPIPVLLDSTPDGWRLDLQRLLDACTPRTKAIFVNTPNNPTGWVMAEDDLRALLDFARKRGLWLIIDEVYRRFIYQDNPPPSILALAEPDDRLIVTHTFSKNWCMTGWRVGWAVIPLDLGGVFENLVQYNTSGTPVFIQRGALAAVAQGDEFLASWVARCHQGRDIVGRALAPLPKVQAPPPAGAFYALLQVEGQGDAMALAKALVDSAQVGLAPGSAFGPGAEGAVRLCFATSHTTLETAMERLVAALG